MILGLRILDHVSYLIFFIDMLVEMNRGDNKFSTCKQKQASHLGKFLYKTMKVLCGIFSALLLQCSEIHNP